MPSAHIIERRILALVNTDSETIQNRFTRQNTFNLLPYCLEEGFFVCCFGFRRVLYGFFSYYTFVVENANGIGNGIGVNGG